MRYVVENCEISFQISGPAWDDDDPPDEIEIVPDDIRDMARWVLLNCVKDQKSGGVITKGLLHSLTWITAPDSEYPGGAART